MLDFMSDDLVFCYDDECFYGIKDCETAFYEIYATKYDAIDYTISVFKNDDNFYEIIVDATYKNHGLCLASMETDQIKFDGVKIVSIKTSMVTFDGSKISAITAEVVSFEDATTNCHKDKITTTQSTSDDVVDRQELIQDFYELLMHCLNDEDKADFTARRHVSEFMNMLSDSVNFCSFEESKKECSDRQEILSIINDHMDNVKSNNYVYEGFKVNMVSDKGNRVSVEAKFDYFNEDGMCVTERTQMDEFVFDIDGKIIEYDNTDSKISDVCERMNY